MKLPGGSYELKCSFFNSVSLGLDPESTFLKSTPDDSEAGFKGPYLKNNCSRTILLQTSITSKNMAA